MKINFTTKVKAQYVDLLNFVVINDKKFAVDIEYDDTIELNYQLLFQEKSWGLSSLEVLGVEKQVIHANFRLMSSDGEEDYQQTGKIFVETWQKSEVEKNENGEGLTVTGVNFSLKKATIVENKLQLEAVGQLIVSITI